MNDITKCARGEKRWLTAESCATGCWSSCSGSGGAGEGITFEGGSGVGNCCSWSGVSARSGSGGGIGGRGIERTKLESEFGEGVQEGGGYGDLAGTLSKGRRLGKFSVQLSERRVRLAYSPYRLDVTSSTIYALHLRFVGSPLSLQL